MPRRAKDVRKPKPRNPGDGDIRATIQERYSNPFKLLWLDVERFHRELPTAEERRAFALEYPAEFLEMFRFIARGELQPADIEFGYDVFQRPWEFFDGISDEVLAGFEAPDLGRIPRGDFGCNHYEAIAKARGAWFKANGLALTRKERAWLKERAAAATVVKPMVVEIRSEVSE